MIGRSRVVSALVLGGVLVGASAPSVAAPPVGTAPPPPATQPGASLDANVLKPRIVSFRRVEPSSGSGPTTQGAAAAIAPTSLSAFAVEIENPGGAAVTSALVVKHLETRPDLRKANLGPFPFTVAARSRTVVRFTDAFPLDTGCGPTRYELSGEGLLTPRFGRITPTCSFKWTTIPTSYEQRPISLTEVNLGKLPLTCSDSWDISAKLTTSRYYAGVVVSIGTSGARSDARKDFPPGPAAENAVDLRGPFRGHEKYFLQAVAGADFTVNTSRPYTLESGRTCTIDGGQLE